MVLLSKYILGEVNKSDDVQHLSAQALVDCYEWCVAHHR